MKRRNLFAGDSDKAAMAAAIYKCLMSRSEVGVQDFYKEATGGKGVAKPSVRQDYDTMKATVVSVCKAIEEAEGVDSIIRTGNQRNRLYRYVGADGDPLKDMRQAEPIRSIDRYWEFCQDSAGFIPQSWLNYFLKDSLDLLEIRTRRKEGTPRLVVSHDRMLKNIEILPQLYDAIKLRQVLNIEYCPYEGESRVETLSPHMLREFNGRWFISGLKPGHTARPYNLPIDRISKITVRTDSTYIDCDPELFKEWFKPVVGLTRSASSGIEPVVIRVYSRYMFGLVESKPFNNSQATVKPFAKYDDGEYGEISLNVILNKELRGRILTYGSELEVVAPPSLRSKMREEIASLYTRYDR